MLETCLSFCCQYEIDSLTAMATQALVLCFRNVSARNNHLQKKLISKVRQLILLKQKVQNERLKNIRNITANR